MAWEVSNLRYSFHEHRGGVLYDFRFNPMHDLESIWWIAIWTLLSRSPAGVNRKMYKDVFDSKRDRFWILRDGFGHLCNALPPEFAAGRVTDPMYELQTGLMEGHEKATASRNTFDSTSYDDTGLPSLFVSELTKIVDSCPDIKFRLPVSHPP